jgi:hypothetical protein
MLEIAAKDVVFHFNKKHLEDSTIPMWILKFKGESFYVNHVDCQTEWSTKETPDNAHTKGAIKIKHCLVTIDDENCATITKLTESDKKRLQNKDKGITRVLIYASRIREMLQTMANHNIKHSPVKAIRGGCGTAFFITEILAKSHLSMLTLAVDNSVFRIIKENEEYYEMYDNEKYPFVNFDNVEEFEDDQLY